jgi:hypothetical protein
MRRASLLALLVSLILPLAFVASTRWEQTEASASTIEPTPSPVPSERSVQAHIPYDPFVSSDILPTLPYGISPAVTRPGEVPTKPAGVDLDVTYIGRTPMYKRYEVWYTGDGRPYLRPGTESDKRWPSLGETVTFTAHILNKGTEASGSFAFKWFIDDIEVGSGTHASLSPGQQGLESYQWSWAHTSEGERLLGSHAVRFSVDPLEEIAETYESNNSLEDRTDALSLVLALTPELYNALETPVDPQYPYSAEDWLQKQIAAMNAAFLRSVYPSAPDGALERVRLDKIAISSPPPATDWSEDGGFFLSLDDRSGNPYYDPESDVSGALLHELTHQLGIIDMYNLDVSLEVPQVFDRFDRPVQMEYWSEFMFPGLMNDPGISPPIYDEHTTLALNINKGYRRGYYGEYLYDVPEQSFVGVLDNEGNTAAGVNIRLYQRSSDPGLYGGRFGTIDNDPEIEEVTQTDGSLVLPNRPVGGSTTTHTGHTLADNPFGSIDVVGRNDEFILELSKGGHQEFHWLDITALNLVAWRDGASGVLEIASHIPPEDAPASPEHLNGLLEFGMVKLEWTPSPSDGVVGYSVYRAGNPAYEYQRIADHVATLGYQESYDFSQRASVYTVTAIDGEGRESGFSSLFYALRVIHPQATVADGAGGRIVLDPQNGYALLAQTADGEFADTRSSYDYHLEYSEYMIRDWQGRLILSHPGDYYTSRHSVQVFDAGFSPSLEFGETGDEPGEFHSPAGVALWSQPCAPANCRFLVSDSGNDRIQIFDGNGNYVSAYGVTGSGEGEFDNPQGLVVDADGDVIVADSGNNRLQVLTFNGTNLGFLEVLPTILNQPTGLATFGARGIIVADTGNNAVKVLDGEGTVLAEYLGPNDGRIGGFNHPRGVTPELQADIVVADSGNGRVVTILGGLWPWRLYLPIVTRGP